MMEGQDQVTGQVFYRPFGGGIDFGERGADALQREIREELEGEVSNLRYLGTLENVFEFEGHPGHEIVLVYAGELSGSEVLNYDRFEREETTRFGVIFSTGVWVPIADFVEGRAVLYPAGLLELAQ